MLRRLALSFFAKSPLLAWPVISLALFVLVFTLVLVRVLSRRERDFHDLASLPFSEGDDRPESSLHPQESRR